MFMTIRVHNQDLDENILSLIITGHLNDHIWPFFQPYQHAIGSNNLELIYDDQGLENLVEFIQEEDPCEYYNIPQ